MTSSDSHLERIRPCLTCGGLIPFSAVECHLCGTPTEGAPPDGERVRSCLNCGIIVRFDQDPCPECGAAARLAPQESDERVKACVQCGELMAFQDLYCGQCGELSIELEEDEIPPRFELNQPSIVAQCGIEMGASVLVVIGALSLGFAGFWILL